MDSNFDLSFALSIFAGRKDHRRQVGFFLAGLVFLACQSPAICQTANAQPQSAHSINPASTSKKPAAPEDILIVQLNDGADREEFDKLMEEAHGTLIRTITAGPTIKLLVIQAEPGKAAEMEKRFSKSKDVARIQRNSVCKVNDAISEQGHGYYFIRPHHFRFFHNHFRLPPGGGGGSPGISPSPTDPFYPQEWDANAMLFNYARNSGSARPFTTPAVFYVLDTGGTVFPGELATSSAQYNASNAASGGSVEPESVHDSGFHGTFVSSVAATTDNGVGFTGMANLEGNRCTVVILRISSDGSTSSLLNIVAALAYIIDTPGFPVGPVNCSFGSAPPATLNSNPLIQQLAQQLSQKGFLLVLAAGNDGVADNSPEQYARRVGAIGPDGNLASFSESGPFPAVAPGVTVCGYTPSGGTAAETFGDGTSFAAPRYCAALIDVMSVLPPTSRTAVLADQIVLQTATPTAQGYRVPNIFAAIQRATGSP